MTQAAAFFDMDLTLLTVNTATRWMAFLRRRGELTMGGAVRGIGWLALYKLSLLDMEAVTAQAARAMTGQEEAAMLAKTGEFYEEEVAHTVAARAAAAVAFHKEQGHTVAILSSSTPYVAERLARQLDIEHVLCTRFVVEGGRFSGAHVRPACYGAGKVHWAEEFARRRGVDLSRSWFYTDSYTDLPMLERVGVPRVINPDTRLARHARRLGWPTERW